MESTLGSAGFGESRVYPDANDSARLASDPIHKLLLDDELKETARHRYVSGFFFAEAYIGVGQSDQAITWREQAYEEHDQWMIFADCYPGLDPLRSEPRFQALLRRMTENALRQSTSQ